MNKEQYDSLKLTPVEPSISAQELTNQANRTLLYGYNFDRETVHVYLMDGMIHWYMPKYEKDVVLEAWDPERLIPTKRTYPELCDYEFCDLLMKKGFHPNFTTWNSSNPAKIRPEPFASEIAK